MSEQDIIDGALDKVIRRLMKNELDKKLKEIAYEIYQDGNDDTDLEWGSPEESYIERIKAAFVEEGWVKLPTPSETVQHRKEWGDEFTYVLRGGVYRPQGNKVAELMTGQEWLERFEKEMYFMMPMVWATADGSENHEILDRDQILKLARKAAGIE